LEDDDDLFIYLFVYLSYETGNISACRYLGLNGKIVVEKWIQNTEKEVTVA
jgi:hypothetical protein